MNAAQPHALPALGAMLLSLWGCGDMSSQPKQTPYAPLASPAPIPSGAIQYEEHSRPPPPLTFALLERGQARYRVFCTPCHGEAGDGEGMIVQRGFPKPAPFDLERLRHAPTQYLVDVMTQGYGAMYSFAQRVPLEDRWAIAAYVRALERSDAAHVTDLTPDQASALQ